MQDLSSIRQSFPLLTRYPDLAYLDNAATTQKPLTVIEGMNLFYRQENASTHRGVYKLAADATAAYEAVRKKTAQLLNAKSSNAIVFTSGATEAINLVAQSFLEPRLQTGSEVVITAMEHHANLIPWQMACKKHGATLRVAPMNEQGEIDLNAFENMLSDRTKMVAAVHICNSLGTVNPIEKMIALARRKQTPVLIDAAQSIASYPLDVEALDCDFCVFSGHKMFGPTGTGVLYGKEEHLETMQPVKFGGSMIKSVTFGETTFAAIPSRFEAGTPNIAGVIGLGHAIDFIQSLDKNEVVAHLEHLNLYAREKLAKVKGLKIIGNARKTTGIISFILEGIHPHDVATFLGEEQIAVRAGHHCTQPVMDFFGIQGTTRASFSIYNTAEEIDRLEAAIRSVQRFFL